MLNKYFNEYVKLIFKKLLKTCNIYNGNSNKRKNDLIEMIVYGCTTNKLSKEPIKDIETNRAMSIFKEKDILIKSWPGYGNLGLKKKDIKPFVNECSVKINEWLIWYYFV